MKKCLSIIVYFAITKLSVAQVVAVSKEPMHRNVFENGYLRVLDVHVLPGDTSLFHKHETPSVFIVLNPVKTGSEVIIESGTSKALLKDSVITFESFEKSPRIHRVWNEDTIEFHVMDVEVFNKKRLNITPAVKPPAFKLVFDEATLRGYRLSLSSGIKITLPASYPYLVVCLDNAANKVMVNNKSFGRKGDYLFIDPGQQVSFQNVGTETFSFAVLEIK